MATISGFTGEILCTLMVDDKTSGKRVKFHFTSNSLQEAPSVQLKRAHIRALIDGGQPPDVPITYSPLLWSDVEGHHGVYIRLNDKFCRRIMKKDRQLGDYFLKQAIRKYNEYLNEPQQVREQGSGFNLDVDGYWIF